MIYQNEPNYGENEINEVLNYMKSGGWLTEYKQTRKFEELVKDFLGVKYVITVTSGTVALALSFMGLGIKGEVIVPDYSIIASATAVELAGAIPKLVDVELSSHCLSPARVEEAINQKTEAIMIVPNNGRSFNQQLSTLARKHNLKVIEDACQCLGSRSHGEYLGTLGDVGCFSLSHHKIVTTGQGGLVVTNDDALFDRVCRIRNYGRSLTSALQDYGRPGYNFKFNDVLASIGIWQMESIEWKLQKKQHIYQRYRRNLEGVVDFPHNEEGNITSVIDILVDEPRKLQSYLLSKEIETRLFYPPIHTYFDGLEDKSFPNACWLSQHGLWLPSSTKLSLEMVDHICCVIEKFYR